MWSNWTFTPNWVVWLHLLPSFIHTLKHSSSGVINVMVLFLTFTDYIWPVTSFDILTIEQDTWFSVLSWAHASDWSVVLVSALKRYIVVSCWKHGSWHFGGPGFDKHLFVLVGSMHSSFHPKTITLFITWYFDREIFVVRCWPSIISEISLILTQISWPRSLRVVLICCCESSVLRWSCIAHFLLVICKSTF